MQRIFLSNQIVFILQIKDNGNENKSKKKRQKGESELERHHSHYLMIDDGTVHDYDLKNYRTRFAIHMAKLEESDDIASM